MKYRDYDIAGIRVRLAAPQFRFRGLAPFALPAPDATGAPDALHPPGACTPSGIPDRIALFSASDAPGISAASDGPHAPGACTPSGIPDRITLSGASDAPGTSAASDGPHAPGACTPSGIPDRIALFSASDAPGSTVWPGSITSNGSATAVTYVQPPTLEIRPGAVAAETAPDRRIDTFDFPDAEALCRLTRQTDGYLFAMETRGRSVRFRIPAAAAGGAHDADAPTLVTTDFAAEDHPALFRFGFWMAFNVFAAQRGIAAIHSSVLIHRGGAVLCLGESGTGKSTHTRLWREHIPGTELLNDDSPLVLIRRGEAVVHGSPWSGKTPCYRNECYPIRAFLRLSQAPANRIERLDTLRAYGALQPSFPPSFAHDERLAERIDALLSELLRRAPVYRLACLPDADAARLACETIFGQNP